MTDLAEPGRATSDNDADLPVVSHALAILLTREAYDEARRADVATGDVQAHRLVGQAVGILMERFEITEDRALHCLQRVATRGHLHLWQVARVLVDRVNARARIEASGTERAGRDTETCTPAAFATAGTRGPRAAWSEIAPTGTDGLGPGS
jgi:hypothetical protein